MAPLPKPISLWPEETSFEDEQAAMRSVESSDYEPRTVTPVAPNPVKDEDKDVKDSTLVEERNANKSDRPSASSNKDKFYHKKWPNPYGAITCNLDGRSSAGSFGTEPNVYPHCHRGPELIPFCGPRPPDPSQASHPAKAVIRSVENLIHLELAGKRGLSENVAKSSRLLVSIC